MGHAPPYPDDENDASAGPAHGATTGGQSRGVKVLLIIAFVLVLLLIVMHLIGGGFRGLH